jgi:pSer/pThr/pTyr-binding forkhead associated (FHA) protein
MDVKLIIRKGTTRSRTIRLLSRQAVIGRLRGCEVRIPSAEVSRRHCLIRTEDGYLTIEDLKSANGTFLNGIAIRGREIVRPGDRIQVGPVTFIVEYLPHGEAVEVVDEVIEAVPVQEEALEVVPLDGELVEDEVLEAIPIEDGARPGRPLELPDLTALPDFELGHGDQWYLPAADELRNILSPLDDPQKTKRPK